MNPKNQCCSTCQTQRQDPAQTVTMPLSDSAGHSLSFILTPIHTLQVSFPETKTVQHVKLPSFPQILLLVFKRETMPRKACLNPSKRQCNTRAKKPPLCSSFFKLLYGQSNLIYSNIFTQKVNYPNVFNSNCTWSWQPMTHLKGICSPLPQFLCIF